jgi:Mce-associated membrane protein
MTELPRTDDQLTTDQLTTDQLTTDQATRVQATDDPANGQQATGGAAPPARPALARPTPGPRPSPTSRARRSAAPAPDGLRRPRPAPAPGEPAALPDGAPSAATATQTPVTQVDLLKGAQPTATVTSPAEPDDAGLLRPLAEPRPRPWGPRSPVWLVAALAVLLLALAGLDGWLVTHQPSAGSKSEREQALSTAKTAVPLILSYDYRHFDSDVSAARGRLTGRAVDDYAQAMAKNVKPTASKAHAVVQAQTDGAGVEAVSGDGKQVTVVVFGEQKVTNASVTAPRIDLFRVRVTLDLVSGQWLVSKFGQI